MVSDFFRDWRTIGRRVAYESALPLLGGGSWVAISVYKGLSFFEALSGFGIGYLFVLAAQGQLLRIAKNVRDEEDADEFRGSFQTLQQAIEELRGKRGSAEDTPTATREIVLPLRTRFVFEPEAFFKQAKEAADAAYGMLRAA